MGGEVGSWRFMGVAVGIDVMFRLAFSVLLAHHVRGRREGLGVG